MKIVAIIQSRIGSSRLPNKAMLCLHGKPIIEWVFKRVQSSKLLDAVVVAIPDTKEDDVLEFYLNELNASVFRGSENDVLARYYFAAKQVNATHIVRICADNPFVSGTEIDNLISYFKNNNYDYVYNHVPLNNNYPDGFGAEMISFANLEKMYVEATSKLHREHCFSYMKDQPQLFSIATFNVLNPAIAHPSLKFDIDTWDDYYYLSTKKVSIDSTCEEIVKIFLQ